MARVALQLVLSGPVIAQLGYAIAAIALLGVLGVFIGRDLWLVHRTKRAGAYANLLQMWGMRFRRSNPKPFLNAAIRAREHGIQLSPGDVEVHELAGGNPQRVIDAMIRRRENGETATWDLLCAIELGGGDPMTDPLSRGRD
jgi:uncharacterized protein YqfA (UPF0365 family)